MENSTISISSLEEPLYYLHNMDAVVSWVSQYHADLLLQEELSTLSAYQQLDEASRALFVRLLMRTHEVFRNSQLHYTEIGNLSTPLAILADQQFITLNPELTSEELLALVRKAELLEACKKALPEPVSSRLRKAELDNLWLASNTPAATWNHWFNDSPEVTLRLNCQALWTRLRLMFFGNLHQSWSEFVLTELGHARYETVHFTSSSRAFQQRVEVDDYLTIQFCFELLDAGVEPQIIAEQAPPQGQCDWVEYRRRKLLFQLGHHCERAGDMASAVDFYQQSQTVDARIRHLRVSEKLGDVQQTLNLLKLYQDALAQGESRVAWQRVAKRALKQSAQTDTTKSISQSLEVSASKTAIPTQALELEASSERVERAVCAHLEKEGWRAFWIENALFNGLFALLHWDCLYAPLPGAFFHPFQRGPADLYRRDFLTRRQALYNEGHATLQNETYKHVIKQRWQEKYGIDNSLCTWGLLSGELVDLSLRCIPPEHLECIFQRMSDDLRNHRRGKPDLIAFRDNEYQLIEVKGPGDRLQDHQTLWLRFFIEHHIPASVMQVTWCT